jgi:hypothetical protein
MLEDHTFVFSAADFGFTDADGNALAAVEITTVPGAGSLTDNGAAVIAGQFIPIADILAGKLTFAPAHDAHGAAFASFTFDVQDDGGNVNGGVDLDPTANRITIDVTEVRDFIYGSSGRDRLEGTADGDTLSARAGNDTINGNAGDDRLYGSSGADLLTGGPGHDVFWYRSIYHSAPWQSGLVNGAFNYAAGRGLRDIIFDFTHGEDKIDLSDIDADPYGARGNQAFRWLGTGDFTERPGQLIERLYDRPGTSGDRTIVYGDVTGDGKADCQIELAGLKHLVARDFLL